MKVKRLTTSDGFSFSNLLAISSENDKRPSRGVFPLKGANPKPEARFIFGGGAYDTDEL